MAWKKVPHENVECFRVAFPEGPAIELRKMFGCPAGFVNGNMFCGAHEDRILVRLDPASLQRALKQPGFTQFAPMGRTMREYVCLPPDRVTDVVYLRRWFKKSLQFAKALPVKKKKARGKAASKRPRAR